MKLTADSPLGRKLIAQGRVQSGDLQPGPRKWRNVPTVDSEGRIHPSKLQALVTDRLRREVIAVIPEVSMPLSARPKDRIRIDCLAIESVRPDGSFVGRFVEIKGRDLGEGKQKRMRFEDRYHVEVKLVRK